MPIIRISKTTEDYIDLQVEKITERVTKPLKVNALPNASTLMIDLKKIEERLVLEGVSQSYTDKNTIISKIQTWDASQGALTLTKKHEGDANISGGIAEFSVSYEEGSSLWKFILTFIRSF